MKKAKPSLIQQKVINLEAMNGKLEELNKEKAEEIIRLRQQNKAALDDKNAAGEDAHAYRRIAEAMASLLALDLSPAEFLGIFGLACLNLGIDPEKTHAKAERVIQNGYVAAVRTVAKM